MGALHDMAELQINKAMVVIHRYPCKTRNVANLATQAGMSRSRFSARFVDLVGETRIAHPTACRRYLAAGQLMRNESRLINVVESVGYLSGKALNRALPRWPGLLLRTCARSVTDLFKREHCGLLQNRY